VVRLGPFDSDPLEVVVPAQGFVVRDLVLPVTGSTADVGDAVGAGRAAVVGTVVDAVSREPVEGAAVRLVDGAGGTVAEALSDARGRVLLLPGEPGSYRVQAARLGYAPTEGRVVDVEQGTRRVEIRLSTEAIPLDEMVVTVRGTVPALDRNGFYQRQAVSDGRFLVREDIAAASSSRTSDVLIRVPGIGPVSFNEESSETNKRRIQFSRARNTRDWRCLPVLYIDGVMVRAGGPWTPGEPERWPTVEELIGPQDIEAIELYPSRLSAPARFQGAGSECGSVVVWTRRGIGG